MKTTYLIVGMNAAGFYAAERLAQLNPGSPITAVDAEPFLPYKRTKINKNFYPGPLKLDNFLLAPDEWYKNNTISLHTGRKVLSLNIKEKTATLSSGVTLHWEKVLIATGADAHRPENRIFLQSHALRTYEDAVSIENLIDSKQQCLVYGLGVLGIETACGLKQSGMAVSLAGRDQELLQRYFSPSLREKIRETLSFHEIPVYYDIPVDGFTYNNGIFSFASDKHTYDFDCMIHALGIAPRTELAAKAGIAVDRGIVVDDYMATSRKNIYAAGDCCQLKGETITDLWHSAQHQGQCAAANMTGKREKYTRPIHRLKTELFDTYCFSMRPFIKNGADEFKKEISNLSEDIQRIFYYRHNKLQGAEMIGDKGRSKLYETAVENHWDKQRVADTLGKP